VGELRRRATEKRGRKIGNTRGRAFSHGAVLAAGPGGGGGGGGEGETVERQPPGSRLGDIPQEVTGTRAFARYPGIARR